VLALKYVTGGKRGAARAASPARSRRAHKGRRVDARRRTRAADDSRRALAAAAGLGLSRSVGTTIGVEVIVRVGGGRRRARGVVAVAARVCGQRAGGTGTGGRAHGRPGPGGSCTIPQVLPQIECITMMKRISARPSHKPRKKT
jgi:hypothetical protein